VKKHTRVLSALALTASFVLSTNMTEAQSLYGYEGAGSLVMEHTGPPGGACGYPFGPMFSVFPTMAPFGCPLPVPPGPPPMNIFGDIGVDKINDTVWVTDGVAIGEFTASGAGIGTPLTGFNPILQGGLPLTGLGMDSAAGWLWLTDGFLCWAITPPAAPGCPGVEVIIIPPFMLPLQPGAQATDVEWDPVTGTLWVCDTIGFVTNVTIAGGMGPFGFFPAGGACGLMPPLQGIALDSVASSVLGIPTYYVTDGFGISYETVGGAPAPATFYTPMPCFGTLGPLVGLAFSARALPYGTGVDNSGLPAPNIGSTGQGLSPNPAFTVNLSGSVPGSTAILYLSWSGFYCPAVTVMGLPVLISLATPPKMMGVALVGAAGTASLPIPIPPGFPPGSTFHLQWLVVTPTSLQVSEGLALPIDLP
jgi:hypothetical protein